METEKEKISITRALVELKLLDKRIKKAIGGTNFVAMRTQRTDLPSDVAQNDNFEKKVKSDYDSIIGLIDRRKKIKAAIVQSNASTTVKVGDQRYAVADAIERKNSISYEKLFLQQMKTDLSHIMQLVERRNAEVERQLHGLLNERMGGEGELKDGMKAFQEQYREVNASTLYDPLDIAGKIEKLEKEIDEFEANIDVVLSESNGITLIEV